MPSPGSHVQCMPPSTPLNYRCNVPLLGAGPFWTRAEEEEGFPCGPPARCGWCVLAGAVCVHVCVRAPAPASVRVRPTGLLWPSMGLCRVRLGSRAGTHIGDRIWFLNTNSRVGLGSQASCLKFWLSPREHGVHGAPAGVEEEVKELVPTGSLLWASVNLSSLTSSPGRDSHFPSCPSVLPTPCPLLNLPRDLGPTTFTLK